MCAAWNAGSGTAFASRLGLRREAVRSQKPIAQVPARGFHRTVFAGIVGLLVGPELPRGSRHVGGLAGGVNGLVTLAVRLAERGGPSNECVIAGVPGE